MPSTPGRARTRDAIVAVVVIALGLAAFFAEPLFTSRVYSPAENLLDYPPWNAYAAPDYRRPNAGLGDRYTHHDPWRMFNRASLARGEAPLWNPFVFGGTPHLANYQSAPFYPPSLALFPFRFETAQLLLAMIHLALAGVFTWLFLRRDRVSATGALFGAVAFMFSGALVIWLGSPAGYVMPWLPALVYFSTHFADTPRTGWWLALYAVVSVQFLGGHPESSYFLLMFVTALFMFRVVGAHRDGARVAVRAIGGFVAAWALGLLTAAFQILPFLEYVSLSHVGVHAYTWRWAALFPAPRLTSLPLLVLPYLYGHPAWGDRELTRLVGVPAFNEMAGVYVGILPLALAVVAARTQWQHARDVRFLTVTALLVLAYFYWIPPIYGMLKATPILNLSRTLVVPTLSSFCVACLAGRGFDELAGRLGGAAAGATRRRLVRRLLAVAVTLVVAVGIVEGVLTWQREHILTAGAARVDRMARAHATLGPSVGHWRGVEFWRARVPVVYENIRWAAATPLFTAALLAVVAAALASSAVARERRRLAVVAVGLTFVDLWAFGARFNASAEPVNVYPATPAIRFLQEQPGVFRIFGVNEVLTPSVGMVYGLSDVRGIDPLVPGRWFGLLRAEGVMFNSNLVNPFTYPRYTSRALDLANVTFVLADAPLAEHARFELVYSGEILVYRNRTAMPRAWLVGTVRRADNADAALRIILDPAFDPHQEAVVEGSAPLTAALARGARGVVGHASIVEYHPRRVTIVTQSQGPALLVLADVHHPGWRARVDGIERPILLTNYAFRSVELSAGEHRIELRYEPRSFTMGIRASLGAVAVAGIAAIVGGAPWRWRTRRRDHAP